MNGLVSIIYFTGTGGVKKIVNEFKNQLIKKNYKVFSGALEYGKNGIPYTGIDENIKKSRFLFLVYPVHAFDAPEPVYNWIENTKTNNLNTIIISVSGGGEAWPNIGTRQGCITAMEKKGFKIIYEKMMVMPSNWVISPNDHLAMWLIKVIPDKVNKILTAILSGKIRKTGKKRKGFLLSYLTKMEKTGAHRFAKSYSISENCNSCGWCERNCPTKNIDLINNKPLFGEKCIMCFRCIYGCPINSIKSDNFQILKKGYNLKEFEKNMGKTELEPMEKCSKGILWLGVAKYLFDKDGF
jgi:ferredoxin